jgi:hypothetical protein
VLARIVELPVAAVPQLAAYSVAAVVVVLARIVELPAALPRLAVCTVLVVDVSSLISICS